MCQTICPQTTAQPAAGINAQAPAPTITSSTAKPPKTAHDHMWWEWFIAFSSQFPASIVSPLSSKASVPSTGYPREREAAPTQEFSPELGG
jgi:hypothetical protein